MAQSFIFPLPLSLESRAKCPCGQTDKQHFSQKHHSWETSNVSEFGRNILANLFLQSFQMWKTEKHLRESRISNISATMFLSLPKNLAKK